MKVKCDGCGKETSFFALSLSVVISKDMKEADKVQQESKIKHSFGIYDSNQTYSFCYECILKTLGVISKKNIKETK
jgi:hypothetical protein